MDTQAELLRIVGNTLWWAEGSKSRRDTRWKNAVSYPIEITNTNPEIIMLFLRYIKELIGVPEEKIRLQLQIHEGDDRLELEQYWSCLTGIPLERFNKTIVRPKGNKPNKTKGTCKIRCYDKDFYVKIASDLQEILRKLA